MGSLVALWLAGHEAKRIVLLGRSGRFPADSPLAAYRCVTRRQGLTWILPSFQIDAAAEIACATPGHQANVTQTVPITCSLERWVRKFPSMGREWNSTDGNPGSRLFDAAICAKAATAPATTCQAVWYGRRHMHLVPDAFRSLLNIIHIPCHMQRGGLHDDHPR